VRGGVEIYIMSRRDPGDMSRANFEKYVFNISNNPNGILYTKVGISVINVSCDGY